jgi:hypothetical protein
VVRIHRDDRELAEAEEGMVVSVELNGIGWEQLKVNEVLGGIWGNAKRDSEVS